jgi:hypothetical protein
VALPILGVEGAVAEAIYLMHLAAAVGREIISPVFPQMARGFRLIIKSAVLVHLD